MDRPYTVQFGVCELKRDTDLHSNKFQSAKFFSRSPVLPPNKQEKRKREKRDKLWLICAKALTRSEQK